MLTWKIGKTKLFSVIVFVFCVVFLLFSFEVMLWIYGYNSKILDADMFVSSQDPILPFKLRPGYTGYYAGGEVAVGLDGLRIVPEQNSDTISRPPDYNLLMLGDSVAFGQGLDNEETVAAQLQSLLRANARASVKMIAAPGYTSWNQYGALKSYDKIDRVNAVILIYVSNDITFDNDHLKLKDGRIHYMEKTIWHKILHFSYRNSRLAFFLSDSLKRLMFRPAGFTKNNPADFDSKALGSTGCPRGSITTWLTNLPWGTICCSPRATKEDHHDHTEGQEGRSLPQDQPLGPDHGKPAAGA